MGFKCGIVGLPNVGKSTLFNALTATAAAQAANYPFCTIEPNVGRVSVPDERLDKLAALAGSQKIIPTQLEFVDIAGLVKGASQGEGLGNQFLAHIREVDAVLHVMRCFDDGDITHVEGGVDPLRDLSIIETELMLADLESLERRLPALQKRLKAQDMEAKEMLPYMEKALAALRDGQPVRDLIKSAEDKEAYRRLQLITSKPILYVCNVDEGAAISGNKYTQEVQDKSAGVPVVLISAAIEAEVALLEDPAEKADFLQSMGLAQAGLDRLIQAGYGLLNLITFFTIGPKEARAWTLEKNLKAPQAAGVIHSDFERGFICAETVAYEDYIQCGGEAQAKAAGKLRLEGKEYGVHDGDVFHFRFNV